MAKKKGQKYLNNLTFGKISIRENHRVHTKKLNFNILLHTHYINISPIDSFWDITSLKLGYLNSVLSPSIIHYNISIQFLKISKKPTFDFELYLAKKPGCMAEAYNLTFNQENHSLFRAKPKIKNCFHS